jgi:hypothetical protein
MRLTRHEFYRSIGGPSGENEDQWAILVYSDSGKMRIEHRWRYLFPYRCAPRPVGDRIYTIGEFSETTDGKWLRPALDTALRELGMFLC